MTHSTPCLLGLCLLAGALAPSTVSAQNWALTYEAPGAGATTSTLSSGGVETFDTRPFGYDQFTSAFSASVNGVYRNVLVTNDVPNGFAGTRHVGALNARDYTLTLNQPVNYFGYYLATADAGNVVSFYSGSQQVGHFDIGRMLISALAGQPAYFQPIPVYGWIEPYAFVNFQLTGGASFDRIEFTQSQMGGHESDNHTVGTYLTIGGVGVVPEAGSLALMSIGLAAIGAMTRRRRR